MTNKYNLNIQQRYLLQENNKQYIFKDTQVIGFFSYFLDSNSIF